MGDETNVQIGEVVNELKASKFWSVLNMIKEDLKSDLSRKLNENVRNETPLITEVNLDVILSSRLAEMGGIDHFFALLEKLNNVYLLQKSQGNNKEVV